MSTFYHITILHLYSSCHSTSRTVTGTTLLNTLTHCTLNFCGPWTLEMKFLTSMDNCSLITTSIIENGCLVHINIIGHYCYSSHDPVVYEVNKIVMRLSISCFNRSIVTNETWAVTSLQINHKCTHGNLVTIRTRLVTSLPNQALS